MSCGHNHSPTLLIKRKLEHSTLSSSTVDGALSSINSIIWASIHKIAPLLYLLSTILLLTDSGECPYERIHATTHATLLTRACLFRVMPWHFKLLVVICFVIQCKVFISLWGVQVDNTKTVPSRSPSHQGQSQYMKTFPYQCTTFQRS